MEEGIKTTEKDTFENEVQTTCESAATESLPSTEFVKVEKNLASLGFFTPSSNRLRNAQEKSFTITTVADGQRLELKGTIIPSAKYGLPITADQDKWIALCKILTDIIRKDGQVTNPVSFTSAEILRLLHKHRHSGKNYREIEEWLDVLFSTTIFSEGVVYLAKEKRRVKDRFRVFDRAVSVGKELSDGKVADKNYVWFSEWQLQNINSNHLLPIDLEAYRELKNHIAKALVPLLQIWLYATRNDGVFEKRYDELCEFLNIRRYQYHSLIVQTLGPSLDELKRFGYLADWAVEKTSEGDSYKIVFYHGEKFHRDRRARLNSKQSLESVTFRSEKSRNNPASIQAGKEQRPLQPRQSLAAPEAARAFDPDLVSEFTRRGITEKKAQELLANLKPDQDVLAQLEHTDHIVQNARYPINNPPGFYIRLISSNTSVPDSFETSAKRKAREENEQKERMRRDEEDARRLLESSYDDYCARETDRYIAENPAIFEAIKDAKREETRALYTSFPPDLVENMAKHAARSAIEKQAPRLPFEEFAKTREQGTVFSLKPVAVSADLNPRPVDPPHEGAVMTDDAVIPPDARETAGEGEAGFWPEPKPAAEPAMPEPVVEPAFEPATSDSASDHGFVPPQPEGNSHPAGQEFA